MAANMPEIPDTSNNFRAPTLTKINCTPIAQVGSDNKYIYVSHRKNRLCLLYCVPKNILD